jgi:hypothetical protein
MPKSQRDHTAPVYSGPLFTSAIAPAGTLAGPIAPQSNVLLT